MNESAKRALEVAKTGGHSICIIGNAEAVILANKANSATIFSPCPCGNYGDRSRECVCAPSEIRAHQKKKPKADIYVDAPRLTFGEWVDYRMPALSKEVLNFFEKAYQALNLDIQQADTALAVARTIAKMDGESKTGLQHLAEALQYRGGEIK